MMRKVVCIIMVVLFLVTMITGIVELVHPDDSAHHIVISILFFVLVCVHSWLNRKALVKHFSRANMG